MKIDHDEDTKKAFLKFKEMIAEDLEKAYPDFKKNFILTTDASDYSIGAILSQKGDNSKEKMISAFSKSLDKAQCNYSTTDKKLLAIVKTL